MLTLKFWTYSYHRDEGSVIDAVVCVKHSISFEACISDAEDSSRRVPLTNERVIFRAVLHPRSEYRGLESRVACFDDVHYLCDAECLRKVEGF